MDTGPGLASKCNIGGDRCWILTLGLLLLLSACAPAAPPDQELRQEVKGLKAEVTALKEQVAKLEAGQQTILALLRQKLAAAPEAPPAPEQPLAPPPLTVNQLIAVKERYLGTRVTVKGTVGTVLMHHKSFTLNSPQGMVEVFFDKLPDAKQVQRLSSTSIDQPVTVTGTVSLPPKGAMKLQINAEAVEF